MNETMYTELMSHRFDSHIMIKGLMKEGMDEPLAEKVIQAISASREFDISNLATKNDIFMVKQEIAEVKQDIAVIRQEIVTLEQRMKADLEKTKNDILKWQLGMLIALTSIMIACFKFFIH